MWANLTKHWFLVSLVVCYCGGYLAAGTLAPLAETPFLLSMVVFAVMWAMGVTLKADMIRQSVSKPLPAMLAIAISVFLVPLLCLSTKWILPDYLFGGLFITALVPCTLASASVWTRKAGGDDSISMMTTVVTNLACLLVVPIGISLVLVHQIQIDLTAQVFKLGLVVVAPLMLAQLMRRFGCAHWSDRNKPTLSLLSQCGILIMVVFGAVASATKLQVAGESALDLWTGVTLFAAASGIHLAALGFGIAVSRWLGFSRESQIAVGLSGSQKTLMVGLQIAIDCGVSVVPMLVYHLSQLFIDTLVAQKWAKESDRPNGGDAV